jgi:hypothetical protein
LGLATGIQGNEVSFLFCLSNYRENIVLCLPQQQFRRSGLAILYPTGCGLFVWDRVFGKPENLAVHSHVFPTKNFLTKADFSSSWSTKHQYSKNCSMAAHIWGWESVSLEPPSQIQTGWFLFDYLHILDSWQTVILKVDPLIKKKCINQWFLLN